MYQSIYQCTSPGALELNAFNQPWIYLVSYVLPSSSFSSIGSFHISGRKSYGSVQTSYSSNTTLDGSSLASHSLQHVGRHSFVSHCKGHYHGCFSWLAAQRSAFTTFSPLAAQKCVLHRQEFSSSVCQAVET